jgi:hypothetical protein
MVGPRVDVFTDRSINQSISESRKAETIASGFMIVKDDKMEREKFHIPVDKDMSFSPAIMLAALGPSFLFSSKSHPATPQTEWTVQGAHGNAAGTVVGFGQAYSDLSKDLTQRRGRSSGRPDRYSCILLYL